MSLMNPPLRLLATYQDHLQKTPDMVVGVPGRDMWVAANVTGGHEYTVITPDLHGKTVFDRRSARLKRTSRNRPLPRWARYLGAVVLVLSEDGIDLPGAKVVIVGDEPAGPRYEHALGMAFVALWYAYHELPYAVDDLLDIMERVQKQVTE